MTSGFIDIDIDDMSGVDPIHGLLGKLGAEIPPEQITIPDARNVTADLHGTATVSEEEKNLLAAIINDLNLDAAGIARDFHAAGSRL